MNPPRTKCQPCDPVPSMSVDAVRPHAVEDEGPYSGAPETPHPRSSRVFSPRSNAPAHTPSRRRPDAAGPQQEDGDRDRDGNGHVVDARETRRVHHRTGRLPLSSRGAVALDEGPPRRVRERPDAEETHDRRTDVPAAALLL